MKIESPQAELVSVMPVLGQAAGMWEVCLRLNGEQPGVARFPRRIGAELSKVTVSIR